MLYDSGHFEDILAHADQFEFSFEQLTKLKNFHQTLQDFDASCRVGVEEMIQMPGWKKVLETAQEVLDVFKNYRVSSYTDVSL